MNNRYVVNIYALKYFKGLCYAKKATLANCCNKRYFA